MSTIAAIRFASRSGISHLLVGLILAGVQANALAFGTQKDLTRNAMPVEFDKLDINHDGWLSRIEAGRDDEIAPMFNSIDLDHDGRLGTQEYVNLRNALQRARMEAFLQDSTITAQVKAELVKDSGINGWTISVETLHGTVILSGFVDSTEQIRRIIEIASGVRGVHSIKNGLQLKG
jgi:hyperosmotically inducible protein